jgi:hypothetical protein
LYDASCTQIGTGLSFTGLTPGDTYTWCITMKAFGGPGCSGFDSFCPYFIDNTISLPIELDNFKAYCSDIEWSTLSETNNDYFILKYSKDGEDWKGLDTILGAGNSYSRIDYKYKLNQSDYIMYYKLLQVDYDGSTKVYGPIVSMCRKSDRYIIATYNILGKKVPLNTKGLVIIKYSDGHVHKVINPR